MDPVIETDLSELSIADEENSEIQVENESLQDGLSFENCFVGLFLTDSVIHFHSMKTTLANVWRPLGGVSISELGEGRYLFRFYHVVDVDRVEDGGPWNFNSHLLILHRLKPGEVPALVPIFAAPFWVLVNDIPPGYMSVGVAKQLGNFLGSFIEYDSSSVSLCYKGIMRIRAEIDTRKPLKRRKKLAVREGEGVYVRFEYEKLPLLCFICGKLGHGHSFCPIRLTMDQSNIVFGWDLGLRAPARRMAAAPTSRWLREEGVGAVPNSPVQISQPRNFRGKLQGSQAGFDVIMAHEDEETVVAIVDGPKRPRTNSSVLRVDNTGSNDASWLLEESCEEEVRRLWQQSSGDIIQRLRLLSHGLESCFRRVKKERKLTTSDLRKRLQDLNDNFPTDDTLAEICDVKLALNLEADREELYWEQRARANWLRFGDRNTGFFHRHASHRRRKNKIHSLEAGGEGLAESDEDILKVATDYFHELFSLSEVSDPSDILAGVDACISADMNRDLLRDFTSEEVHQAARSMGPMKASGEDGLGAVFYQRFWHIIGRDVSEFCIDLLQDHISELNFNVWLRWMFDRFTANRHQEILIIIWAIWFARNKLVHENTVQTRSEIVTFIRGYLAELKAVSTKLSHPNVRVAVRWVPPHENQVKINVDASFSSTATRSTSGMIIRDNKGLILGAAYRINFRVYSVFEAEALAVLQGLQFGKDIGCNDVCVEGDAKSIIRKLQLGLEDLSTVRPIIADIKALAKRFRSCSFSFVGRSGNRSAHEMAEVGRSQAGDEFWIEDAPSTVVAAADADSRWLEPP
ncbi:hypothetical protein GQ457_04G031690 [Hibiscus cannabinus]